MRFFRCAQIILFGGLLGGCASSASDIGQPLASEPRAYVMQYAAVYYGGPDNTAFDWLELRRDGTFATMIAGALREGCYEEKDTASREPTIEFNVESETFVGTLHTDWASGHRLSVSRDGAAESLTTSSVGGESVCEESGGAWRDDDADGDGLYCTCPQTMKYIPSAGGCTH